MRSIRHHTFVRTNQFEVADRIKGLEERFRVVGRDALADAYRQRLDALEPHRDNTTPDILHFLLELADQPAQKSKLTDLDLLKEPEPEPEPVLTWKEIAKEDGWKQERDIWRLNNWEPDSSDEEQEVDARSVASAAESLTSASSADERTQRTALDLASKPQGEEALQKLAEEISWRYHPIIEEGEEKTLISTLHLLREVLFMLGGLETTVFNKDCNPGTSYQLRGISAQAHQALVTSFAECGRKLAPLRAFAKGREQSPLLQVFQHSVQKALHNFDTELAVIQARFVAIKEDVVVSLVGILAELRPKLKPLYALAGIVRKVQEERNPHAFRYLELLYDAVGTAQLQGHNATYELLGNIFLECFQVYLKPIRMWMEEGRLLPGDRTFFVSESPTKLPLPQIWKSQFNLLRTPEGNLHAPRFLKPAIHRIFTAGKSIVVLKHMRQQTATRKYQATVEPKMDFATVCSGDEVKFAPFSELFGAAFQAWIQSKHHTAAATLRELLYSSYGLSRGLDTLEQIYLMSDGASSTAFTAAIFRHLDNLSTSWKDRFTLTEIAQEAFSSSVDGYRIFADVDPRALTHSAVDSRGSVRLSLPAIRVGCRLNWPVQIVVPEEGVRGYQTIFTFLLQTRRAVSLLQHPIKDFHPTSMDASGQTATYYLLRTKLLWFCNLILTYLTTLVLAPNTARLRTDLRDAADVDDMISAHSEFISRIHKESCQGAKLQPIRECILDVFDLAIKVEDAQGIEMARLAEEEQEINRLSVMSSPYKSPSKKGKGLLGMGMRSPNARKKRAAEDEEEDDEDGDVAGGVDFRKSVSSVKPHHVVLKEMHSYFERYLRFIAGGLRGVARASKEEAASRWDLLAEMLEAGIKD